MLERDFWERQRFPKHTRRFARKTTIQAHQTRLQKRTVRVGNVGFWGATGWCAWARSVIHFEGISNRIVNFMGLVLFRTFKGSLTGSSMTDMPHPPTQVLPSLLPSPLFNLLKYISKASPQGLVPYLATSSSWGQTLRSSFPSIKVQKSKAPFGSSMKLSNQD